jgi:hypothetical protein
MPGFLDDTDECVCGHIKDEHAKQGFFLACQVDGCECGDYEWNGESGDGVSADGDEGD